MPEKVDQIYKVLTRRKVRKAWPLRAEQLKDHIRTSLEEDGKLTLTTTWLGVKTTRKGIADAADQAALLFLKKNIVDKLKDLGIRCEIKLLFADTNASYLEGYTKEKIDLYWRSLKPMVNFFGFILVPVNKDLWKNMFKLDGNEEMSVEEIAEKSGRLALFKKIAPLCERVVRDPYFEKMKEQAEKHSLLVKTGKFSAEQIAKRYLYFRAFALHLYKEKQPHEIYFSYALPEYQELFTPPPVVYFFSLYRGISDCPWFIDENNEKLQRLIKMGRIQIIRSLLPKDQQN